MSRAWWAGMVLLAASGTVSGDEPKKPVDSRPVAGSAEDRPGGSVAERFRAIVAEYEALRKTASVESDKGKTEFESWKIYGKLMPDEAAFSRRLVDLAATDPKDPAARDALLWVLNKPGMGPGGPYSDEFTRAVLLLLRHHGDDPEVARIGLQLDNNCTAARDLFLEGLCVRAKGREAQGLARMALAQYLEKKAKYCAGIRNSQGPIQSKMRIQTYDDDGKLVEKESELPIEHQTYQLQLRLCDPEAMRSEAKRLIDEVIKDYGDVPYVTRRYRELETLLKEPSPTLNGEPLKPEDRKQIEKLLARKRTLADVARAKLDEMENLIVGKPAPAIDGTGMDGRPLKLADYRGKVVVLVFWGTWCGPCMREVPHEREMAERYKDKPFALLGVDADGDKDAALKVMKDEKITWPNWNDGDPGEGPIVKAYHVRGFPTTFVLDARGIIRHIGPTGSRLDKAVEDLLEEQAAKGKPASEE
jgi:thiol-disulfide isomerase/thioredoxin